MGHCFVGPGQTLSLTLYFYKCKPFTDGETTKHAPSIKVVMTSDSRNEVVKFDANIGRQRFVAHLPFIFKNHRTYLQH